MIEPLQPPPRRDAMVMAVGIEGGLVLLWCAIGAFTGLTPGGSLEITFPAIVDGVVLTLPLLPLLFFISRSGLGPFRKIMTRVDSILVVYLYRLNIVDFALLSLLAGIGEEGLFRGVLQGHISDALSPASGLILSNLLFGLVHFITPAYALFAGILGMYLGSLYLWSENLIVSIVVHALYDFIALLYLVRWRGRNRFSR